MPIVTVELSEVTKEEKKKLIKGLTDKVTEVTDVPAKFINIIIKENKEENLGVGGKTVAEIKAEKEG